MKTQSRRPPPGFTLIELLTVIAIIGILAAIIIPTVGKVRSSARTAQTLSNLRQIGMAVNLYVEDSKGFLPDDYSDQNIPGAAAGDRTFWPLALNSYIGSKLQVATGQISSFFTCPVYTAIIGATPSTYRGGYSFNRRMGWAAGESNPDPWTQNRHRLSKFTNPTRTVYAAFGFWEGFIPNADGTMTDDRFSEFQPTVNVPHHRRIGADSNGLGGSSGAYLFLDASVRKLTPEEAKVFLKRQT